MLLMPYRGGGLDEQALRLKFWLREVVSCFFFTFTAVLQMQTAKAAAGAEQEAGFTQPKFEPLTLVEEPPSSCKSAQQRLCDIIQLVSKYYKSPKLTGR